MFLRCNQRRKDGKTHRYWSLVENRRVSGGRVIQRQLLYLGEINDSQHAAWRKTVEVFGDDVSPAQRLALFPEDRAPELGEESVVRLRIGAVHVERPRQWGACWLAAQLYARLGLDAFWAQRLQPGRKGTRWDLILQALVTYRLIDPGSEWRLHREWFVKSALPDLLGSGFELVESHKLYRCLDRLLKHKRSLFEHLTRRWADLFNASYEVLLYDLTSTYFESDPPSDTHDKRKHGYSRDKRSDCTQVLVALVITPEGFPLAYEVLSGNVADNRTLRLFLRQIERQYGKARRVWLMDRGIPTEAVLQQMRAGDPPVQYLVGTPKGRLGALEAALLEKPWRQVRDGVKVKLLAEAGELYVLAHSRARVSKEQAMRRRQLKRLWARLQRLAGMRLSRDRLWQKLGAAQKQWPAGWRLVHVVVDSGGALRFTLNRLKLRLVRRREGRYLLRTNLIEQDPVRLWELYMRLVQVEEAFRTIKGDLALRPIYHQKPSRIEAHIFVAFLAYALHVTLRSQLRPLAPGLTPRAILEKFRTIPMVDIHLPTTDGREIVLPRYTQPDPEVTLLLQKLRLNLPPQPRPRINAQKQIIPDRSM